MELKVKGDKDNGKLNRLSRGTPSPQQVYEDIYQQGWCEVTWFCVMALHVTFGVVSRNLQISMETWC